MLGSLKWGGDLARRYAKDGKTSATPAEKVALLTPYTPDFRNIRISNVLIENCSSFISAIGLPERPLRDVLIRNTHVLNAEKLGIMRDISSFVVLDSEIHTALPNLSKSDGLEGVMLEFPHWSPVIPIPVHPQAQITEASLMDLT